MSVVLENRPPAGTRQLSGKPKVFSSSKPVTGTICILLKDGTLVGPFTSRFAARYWAIANNLDAFSTYDVVAPNTFSK